MFTISDFRVQATTTYPYLSKVWQSWYSPILGNKSQGDSNLSACVTLGLYSNPHASKNEVYFLSCVDGAIRDSVALTKHIKCMAADYLNKTKAERESTRRPNAIIFECEKGKTPLFLSTLELDSIFRAYPEHMGGDLENRIVLAHPLIKKVMLTNAPGTKELRPDDAMLVSRFLSYPQNPDSYAIVSAFVQAILYARQQDLFRSESEIAKKSSRKEPSASYGHWE